MDDELIDDVFEDENQFNPKHFYQNKDTGLNLNENAFLDDQTPSPTGKHPAFRNVGLKSNSAASEIDDGWKSFRIVDDTGFDEEALHKVFPLLSETYQFWNVQCQSIIVAKFLLFNT